MSGDIRFANISIVSISDDLIARVARRTRRSIDEVRAYLKTDQQDDELLRAFLFFGVGPRNKRFTRTEIEVLLADESGREPLGYRIFTNRKDFESNR